ncbi:MAG: Nitrogen fixation protein fixI [Candidatus Midichloriaceae bacterium]|jgi:Cu2+-exporting ATPase|nr:Nitrogen fixation protein fixI [Candidatus Midichloriaceae bacterium]
MSKCKHCEQNVNGKADFCCTGCQIAYNLIGSLNLSKYYEYCKNISGSKPMKINAVKNQLNYSDYIQSLGEDSFRINLLVEGIHCSSCVWLIENTLRKHKSVKQAHINMSTRRLIIIWEGSQEDLSPLIEQIFALGYKLIPFTPQAAEEEAKEKEKDLLIKIGVSGLVNVAMMMIIYGVWAGNFDNSMGHYTRLITHILASLIAIPAIIYSGSPFFHSAFKALKAKRTNMDVPITIGILGATFISIQETLLGSSYTYYDAAIGLIFFLLIGRFLDLKSRNRAREFAHNLLLNQPKTITLEIHGKLVFLPLSKANVGDIAFVSVGERSPADGIIIEGETEVDNSLITGESMPVALKVGDTISCGTLNLGAPIKLRIKALADDTLLGEIIRLIEVAEQSRSRYVRIADQVSRYFTPVVLILSLITFTLWYFIWNENFSTALLHSIALLIITCPCALGLAVPVVQVLASSRLMAGGVIVKSPDALEKLSQINHIVFDKTGTLTEGKPQINNRELIDDKEFEIISSLASFSKHPLCKQIASSNLSFDNTQEIKGQGLTAEFKGETIKLGSRSLCGVTTSSDDSYLEMWYKRGDRSPIRLTFLDKLRPDVKETLQIFKELSMKIDILSGDRAEAVIAVAEELYISNYQAGVSPKQKYEYLKLLSDSDQKVLMVGDGLNDAAAFKAAFVSISPSSSLEITQTNSDIIFQGQKLWPIAESFKVSLKSSKLVKQNFGLALLYNILTVPLAMLGYVNPIVAAITMSTSSIIVVVNSLRVKR